MDVQSLRIPVLSAQNESTGEEVELPPAVASQPPREHLIYEVVKMQLANRRAGTAATKTKGKVRGGGKKPWRQKGTGRARSGSNRSPIWVGGGTVFGPQPRSYTYRLPRSARRTALAAALAQKQRDGQLIVVSEISLLEAKTKRMVEFLSRLEIANNTLIVIADPDQLVERTARNLPTVKVLRAEGLNVYDLLHYRHCLLTKAALERVNQRFAA